MKKLIALLALILGVMFIAGPAEASPSVHKCHNATKAAVGFQACVKTSHLPYGGHGTKLTAWKAYVNDVWGSDPCYEVVSNPMLDGVNLDAYDGDGFKIYHKHYAHAKCGHVYLIHVHTEKRGGIKLVVHASELNVKHSNIDPPMRWTMRAYY